MASSEIRWLSTNDAASRLGVSLRTLYKFIDEGQLPAYKFGRVIRLQHLYPDAKGVDID
jgi:excisionase family DNA binding protein